MAKKDLSPEDIRRIRESLGLSRAEAGEILGGGPRAFTKYESGIIRPTASVINLLLLLEQNPSTLVTLTGRKPVPISNEGLNPFEVTGQHVAALTDRKFANLVRRLLNAEARSANLPTDGIHVAAQITVSDEGEDGRIKWQEGPERTKYLPSRFCVFQLKAGKISPAEAGEEVLNSERKVQPLIKEALSSGGTYLMLCAASYTEKQIKKRENKILESLTGAGISITNDCVQFRDADQIADWVNTHPAVAIWLLEQTQPGLTGSFRDWTHWASRHEHDISAWVNDSRLPDFRNKLLELITPLRGVARVVGLSGIGKSRLALEALSELQVEEQSSPNLKDIVLYTMESEVGDKSIKAAVQSLADTGARAIVVVDRCTPETHQDLVAMVKRPGSKLSLMTIDHVVPSDTNLPKDTLLVREADKSVIDGMLRDIVPGLPDEERERLCKFSKGFPQIARLIGDAWLNDIPIASASDEKLIERIILGRNHHEAALLQDAAMLLGVFGLIGVKAPLDSDLVEVANLSRNRTPDDLRMAFDDLRRRTVVQQRGRLITLQIPPIAMDLAERQWRQWSQSRWDEILTGCVSQHLRERAAKQLSLLNTKSIAQDVVRHVCRLDGPISTLERISWEGNSEVLSFFAEINGEIVVTLLEHVLSGLTIEERKEIKGDVRRDLVRALEKIAFVENTFERGALLLLDLAVAENETWSNNATGQFKSLFPGVLADTEAGPAARLRVIDEVISEGEVSRLSILVDALLEGVKMNLFSRSVGSEVHGSRPMLEPWMPRTWEELRNYVRECSNRLVHLAKTADRIGDHARAGMGRQFRMYVGHGLIGEVEKWTNEVTAVHPYWPEALESLGDFLQYDVNEENVDVEERVRKLISKLTPNSLIDRVRFLVTEMPWDYPPDEKLDLDQQKERQTKAVDDLAAELLGNEKLLKQLLPQLSAGDQRMAMHFGHSIAERAKDALEWRTPVINAVKSVPEKERNFSLMAGYFSGLALRDEGAFEEFKLMASKDVDLAPALPIVCWSADIRPNDITLVCGAMRAGLIPPHTMRQWALGGRLAQLSPEIVSPLFTQMLEMGQPHYSIALDLMGMYVHRKGDRLEKLRPQLRLAADLASSHKKNPGSQMDAHHFERLIKWLLSRGSQDADARAVALALTKQLVANPSGNETQLIKPLLPVLLSDFAEIVWPLVGQAVVADKKKAWYFQLQLGDRFSFSNKQNPAILKLSEDMLFAWCHAHPDAAPEFLARVAPVLTRRDADRDNLEFHPIIKRLLDEFGDCKWVLDGIYENMHSFGWSGSLANYYALYEKPLQDIENHQKGSVRQWAKKMLMSIRNSIDSAREEDEEQKARWEV